jgi:anti-sigma-K factor RskA
MEVEVGRAVSPADLRELLGAYALDALEPDERARVDALLLRDQDARAEVHALQLAAAWLARSDLRPSERAWQRIRSEIEIDAGADVETVPPTRLVDHRRRRVRRVVSAVAAAVVAGVLATAVILASDGNGGRPIEAAARDAATDPHARIVELRTPEGGFAARLAVDADGHGFVVRTTLPDLDGRRTYQLWAITPSGPVSAAVMGRAPRVAVVRGADAGSVSKYAITVERQDGSTAPTGAFVASSGQANA